MADEVVMQVQPGRLHGTSKVGEIFWAMNKRSEVRI